MDKIRDELKSRGKKYEQTENEVKRRGIERFETEKSFNEQRKKNELKLKVSGNPLSDEATTLAHVTRVVTGGLGVAEEDRDNQRLILENI